MSFLSFQDSSVTPVDCTLMASVEDYLLENDDETIDGIERGELMDLGCPDGDDSSFPSHEEESREDADPVQNAFGKGTRQYKKTSIIHKEMKVVTDVNGIEARQCNWCRKNFKIDPKSKSTSSGKRHLLTCIAKKRAMNGNTVKQTTLGRGLSNDEGSSSMTWQYDHSRVRELAAHVVLGHECSFSLLEGVIINKFLKAIYPWYQKISRYTVTKDCKAVYALQKSNMKVLMSKVDRVSLTTDLWWSSEQKIGYMTVTGHYIDSKWQLNNRVLSFINVPPPHSGAVLARELIKVMDDWALKNKVVSITVDNASANDSCIRRLKEDFSGKINLLLDGKLFHVRCCAHIINLLVKDGLSVIQDEIEKIRGGVKYLITSEKRSKEFNKIILMKGLDGKRQVLDNNTRWNSTWLMLSIACYYKTCWPRYAEEDPSFANYLITESEWDTVEEICKFLQVFADVTTLISGSYYPTVNLFIVKLWKMKALLDRNASRYDKRV